MDLDERKDPDERIENVCVVCKKFEVEKLFIHNLVKTFWKKMNPFHEKDLLGDILQDFLKMERISSRPNWNLARIRFIWNAIINLMDLILNVLSVQRNDHSMRPLRRRKQADKWRTLLNFLSQSMSHTLQETTRIKASVSRRGSA